MADNDTAKRLSELAESTRAALAEIETQLAATHAALQAAAVDATTLAAEAAAHSEGNGDPVDPDPIDPGPIDPPPPWTEVFASGLPWRSGFRMAHNTAAQFTAGQKGIAEWRGRPTDFGSTFMGSDIFTGGWERMASNWVFDFLADSVKAGNTLWTIATPLLIKAEKRNFEAGANGDFDRYHAACAKGMAKALGNRPVIIRLGWEGDRGYFWSWDDGDEAFDNSERGAATFKAFWNRTAAIYKAAMPKALLDFNVLRNVLRPMKLWAPESADIYSVDTYDSFSSPFFVDDPVGWMGTYDPSTGWPKGPRGIAMFAKAQGKYWAAPEWGITNRDFDPKSKANNGAFINAMFDLFIEFREHLYYECYFQGGSKAKYHDIYPTNPDGFNNKGRDAYLKRYKAGV